MTDKKRDIPLEFAQLHPHDRSWVVGLLRCAETLGFKTVEEAVTYLEGLDKELREFEAGVTDAPIDWIREQLVETN